MTTETKKSFRPLHDKLIVKRDEKETKTKGGLILPDQAQEKPKEGEVVAAGPGRYDNNGDLIPMQVRSGHHVMFSSYAGAPVKINDEDYLIMSEDDVLAIVE